MRTPSKTLWRSADRPYLHPHGDSWRVRRTAWGPIGLDLSGPADTVLSEFDRRSRHFNQGRPMPVMLDDARALGRTLGHTSRVRWTVDGGGPRGKALLIYVNGRSRASTYPVCHETVHNLLYADGLTRLRTPPRGTAEDIALISQISTSTSHPLVAGVLESSGWAVTVHEAARAERFLRVAAQGRGRLTEPSAALIAAEFTVVLGHFWLEGARGALRRVGPLVEPLTEQLLPSLEACTESIDAVEEARGEIAGRLLFDVEVRGVNPLVRVPGPGHSRRGGSEPCEPSCNG